MTDLEAALRAVTLAREVERLSEGHTGARAGQRQAKRNELGKVTDIRVLEAVHAGASTRDLARALGVGISRAQERVRLVRKAAGEWVAPGSRFERRTDAGADNTSVQDAEESVSRKQSGRADGAPNSWLKVPRCGAIAPPPWPVWARCLIDRGHRGDHRYDP